MTNSLTGKQRHRQATKKPTGQAYGETYTPPDLNPRPPSGGILKHGDRLMNVLGEFLRNHQLFGAGTICFAKQQNENSIQFIKTRSETDFLSHTSV
jgi:hypothetical protein